MEPGIGDTAILQDFSDHGFYGAAKLTENHGFQLDLNTLFAGFDFHVDIAGFHSAGSSGFDDIRHCD
jgi:hypothetical protein